MPQQKRVLLTTVGSFGDLHPYMAVALEMKARGILPVVATSAAYRAKVESAGLMFAPLRPDLPGVEDAGDLARRVMDLRRGTEVVVREWILGSLRAMYDDTLRAADGCDLIVSHGLTYASPIVAEQKGIPWAYAALQPIVLFSAFDPPSPPSAPWFPKLRALGPGVVRALMTLGASQFESWSGPVRELREELRLTQGRSNPLMGVGAYSPYLNLALFSKELAPAQPDWPPNTVQTGFAFYDHYDCAQTPMPPSLAAFLDTGPPPIVFTLGTAAVRDAGRFFHESIAAASMLGRRAVLLTGHDTGNEAGLAQGDGAIAAPYAPFAELFPRAAANVHQGGIGTTGQALRAGRPMLIMPYAHDQPDNAARCERIGVALSLSKSRYDAGSAARALDRLLTQKRFQERSALVAASLRKEDGARAAADAIERLLRG